ncbi:MAG: DUF559 domain-containing protein, partial [Acidimicrobiia bacterium]
HLIASRLDRGLWTRLHDGVYQVDRRPPEWEDRLAAAVLACGPSAAASHRAALVVWGLDGIRGAPLEVTMPFGNLGFPEGVIVHRTRRPWDRVEARQIPVTTVERTLLDSGALLPDRAVGKALDSALRMGLTTMEGVQQTLATEGGRGVRGTRRLRRVMSDRSYDVATDSGAEFDILHHMKLAALPPPELNHVLFPRGDRRIPDFFWPDKAKAVEIDGVDAHSSADKLDDDLERQNAIMDLGIEIRRFSARRVRRDPDGVVRDIAHFLQT